MGRTGGFKGVIDLILDEGICRRKGKLPRRSPLTLKLAADEARTRLIEAAAEGEDSLLEKYLDSGELTD